MREDDSGDHSAKVASFVDGALHDDTEVKRLAGLPLLDYERERVPAAEKLGCRVASLDRLVDAERTKDARDSPSLQGRPLEISNSVLWPTAVDGAAVLDDLVKAICQYVVVSDVEADAIALWAAHTYAHDASETSPKLVLTSAQKRSGKTRAVEMLSRVVARPLVQSGITPAALLRVIELYRPTVLLDELDAAMKGDRETAEALRGLFNSGFDRAAARFVRNVQLPDGGYEPREFSTWCPMLLSGIGTLPDTVRDRSIEINMRRKLRDQKVSRLRRKDGAELSTIGSKLARFAADNMESFRNAAPETPDGLNDRAADAWEPLFAIADLAGGQWPERARAAALALSGEGAREDNNRATMLLADIRQLFDGESTGILFSGEIVGRLLSLKDRPWGEANRGKPITQNWLAEALKAYVIPQAIRRAWGHGSEQRRGYRREWLEDTFARYLPDGTVTPSQTQENQSIEANNRPSQANGWDGGENAKKGDGIALRDGVTDRKPRSD